MEKILNLISLSYNEKESENYANFKPKENEIDTLIEAAKEALSIFPNIPGACVPLSSLLTSLIRDNTNYPIHAIAGSLYIDNKKVFHNESDDFKALFKKTNLEWDGHCWIILEIIYVIFQYVELRIQTFLPLYLKIKYFQQWEKGKEFLFVQLINY
ncbi:hypothetical protein [Arcobacter caeni]|uniref:Uncharacterized protein n=1 Tax=Arcobacter caeni TaxID=1912877 RepID=A0A363D136_9BACT|nr:hypothetical protein [Arcobacter caeni]PUE65034.1 hypothetical protein B0174_05880 [Arcobacter caeni]